MRINHNIAALNTYRQLTMGTNAASKSMEKLSSGLRINRAGDDAAGLAISEKMRGQIRGLEMASKNAQDGISLIQTAEGALNETHAILQRMRELAVQAANDTNTDADRAEIQKEINQLTDEIDRIATTTEFNTKKLLNGDLKGVSASTTSTLKFEQSSQAIGFSAIASAAKAFTVSDTIRIRRIDTTAATNFSISNALGNITLTLDTTTGALDHATAGTLANLNLNNFEVGQTLTITITGGEAKQTTDKALRFQIGANTAQEMSVDINDMSAQALKIKNGTTYLDVSTQFGAEASIAQLDVAIEKVSAERSKLGAFQNRLEHTINNLGTSAENLTAAESRIRDVDMAKEMMEFTKNNILSQAAQAMLAQANQQPQGVLQLLR
ncbi:flagellin [Geobacillus zalihae]|jgi:flagellin|uniref:flagellin N-terminal helical domain-containing protein n=1 Tax=Geobacillus zalihae TaxID=213419 RepID=UPI002617B094|nr:flagellin [Geobacillus zalihae]WKA47118.1 flagellin [Geobacillus zalihae]